MRRDTKVVVGILVLALAAVGAIVWRAYGPGSGGSAQDGPGPSFPRDPCQALTIEDVNAVAAVPEDSYYRTIPVLAWNTTGGVGPLHEMGLAFQTDPWSCQYEQDTTDTPADPVIRGVETRWAAEWSYAHVAARHWTAARRAWLADTMCRSVGGTAGSQDALWCEDHGLILLWEGRVFGFRVTDTVVPTGTGLPVTTTRSEPGARRMAERILGRIASGDFPPLPPTAGPDSGGNTIVLGVSG
ncbi:hypothetical protein [Streptomyces sp. NPDC094049]|uniref:hypothetical protein n=1 Tax=Streptomyces sp. NPDC094049 TaxID=3154987 RepID=UPI00332467CD